MAKITNVLIVGYFWHLMCNIGFWGSAVLCCMHFLCFSVHCSEHLQKDNEVGMWVQGV
jgi:hypothetical protein